MAQENIFSYGHGLHQHEMLINHADAFLDGVPGGREAAGASFNQDASLVRPQPAGQHAHKGALPGPVLTEQGFDPTGPDVQTDAAVGVFGTELFAQPFEPNEGNVPGHICSWV